ncbi:MAG: peptidylprolyl isomerase [Patescibacteria group bacterium]
MNTEPMQPGSMGSALPELPKPEAKKPSPRRMFTFGVGAVLLLAIVIGVAMGIRSTRRLGNDPATIAFAKIFGTSIARINGLPIRYADYMTEVNLLKKFYSSAPAGVPAPSDEQLSDQVLGNLLINTLITDHAEKYQASVTNDDIVNSPAYQQLLGQFGGDRAATDREIQSRYNLTLDQYTDKVVRPIVVEQKLQKAFEDSINDEGKAYEVEQIRASHILFPPKIESGVSVPKAEAIARGEAQKVLNRLRNGEDFATLAGEYGSDGTKDVGGDLGWFGKGRMVPEFENAIWALPTDTLAPEPVKTQFGYHVVEVTGRRMARDYTRFMGDQIKAAKVDILLPVHDPFPGIQEQLNSLITPPPVN